MSGTERSRQHSVFAPDDIPTGPHGIMLPAGLRVLASLRIAVGFAFSGPS
jgi:hypothetical protein